VQTSRQNRWTLVDYLQRALALSEKIKDASTAYLIERALDQIRSTAIGADQIEELH
jgi:hypothetical protein